MMMLRDLKRESKFLAKQKPLWALLAILLMLSSFAVYTGVNEIRQQSQTLERLLQKDRLDREDVLSQQTDFGSAAYYSFHLTYAPPQKIAFAAMGQRDVFPWKHRVRMLALEGQIYETDADNPELTFLGKFDFAFLVSVLLPLLIILLLHNIASSEREMGRFDLLLVTAKKQRNFVIPRAFIIICCAALVLILPFITGALVLGTDLTSSLTIGLIALGHLVFWAFLTLFAGHYGNKRFFSSARIASGLIGIWLLLTVILPVASDTIIKQSVTSPNGGEIVLTQREAVNDAWDLPVESTWRDFLVSYPQWSGSTNMQSLFEWKWYFAFQQVGDQKAAALSKRYRNSIVRKDHYASLVSWLSPPMLSQRLMEKIAHTNVSAALAYEDNVRKYHTQLREFYYPLLFNDTTFTEKTLTQVPEFSPLDIQD